MVKNLPYRRKKMLLSKLMRNKPQNVGRYDGKNKNIFMIKKHSNSMSNEKNKLQNCLFLVSKDMQNIR